VSDINYFAPVGSEDSGSGPLLPSVPSYLVGADNHQLGNNNSSIFDPTTWGDRVDNGFKFSVSMLTRAVSSTYNSAVTVGSLVGLADETDKADTYQWLQSMDDDLARYYDANKSSVDVFGDVVGMFAPGLAGIKVLNWAQKGVAAATEGRAGWALASNFGTLPSKQASFARAAQAEIASSTNTYSLINANLAKSLGAGYAQSAIEFAAFDVAAASTMKDSPLFTDHDLGDIAYNALLGGGMIGAGIMGTAVAVSTVAAYKAAGKVVDEATHAYRTVRTEPTAGTPANEALAIHLNNVESLPRVAADDLLKTPKEKAVAATRAAELDRGRESAHALVKGDSELGNTLFDTLQGANTVDVSRKMAGVTRIGRAGIELPEEAAIAARSLNTTALSREVTALEAKLYATDINISEYGKVAQKLTAARNKLGATESKIAEANAAPIETQYMGFFGADKGVIFDKAPTLRIADKSRSEAEVLVKVSTFKHAQGKEWSIANAAGDADNIEARFIHAQETVFNPEIAVGVKDIPFLERGYLEMTRGAITEIKLRDGQVLDKSALWHHLEDTKLVEANKIHETNLVATGEAALTTEDIAKMVNISPSRLQGQINVAKPETDLFALQTAASKYTEEQIALGNWRAGKGDIKTYLRPHYAKVVFDTTEAAKISGHEINGMVAIRQQQRVYKQDARNTTDVYFDEATRAQLVPEIPGHILVGANRQSVGGSIISSQNGDYNTLASLMQQIGTVMSNHIKTKADNLATTFAPSGHKILTDKAAGTELWKTVQQLRMTPEKYTLVGNELVNIKQARYEAEIAGGADAAKVAKPIFEDAKAPVRISLESEGMREFATEWNTYHKTHRGHIGNLRASQGLEVNRGLDEVFYVPPVDSRSYPHFAFVVDDSLTSTGHISMIHANTAAELEGLANKVPTDTGLKVIYKDQSERWHKAMKDYDYDLGINENYIDTALRKSGASAPFYAVTDEKKLWDDLMGWRQKQDAGLARDMLELRYSSEFAELRRQGEQYSLAETSRKGYVSDIGKVTTANPYSDYIRTAMDVSREGSTPIWSAVNRLAETGVSKAVSKLDDTFKGLKSPAELEVLNKELQSIGCAAYTDAATYALANHTAPKEALSRFIRGANSLLSFTMLRSDPMNAINNGIGHAVLYGTELPRLIKDVMKGGGEGAAVMSAAVHVTVPGTASKLVSPSKIASNAYAAWWDKIVGGSDGGALYSRFKNMGLLPSYTDQLRLMADNLTLRGGEKAADLDTRLSKAFAAAKTFGEKAEKFSGNSFAEEMNRFVSAHTAMQISDIAIAQGKLLPELQNSVINTFVNRTQGVSLASQRPLMFRGPIGQAIGLFQTYQFNMIQQMLRYVGEGDRKSVATLLGLQGSIYGLNGLPAFNAVNNYLVGNAAGNTSHKDIVYSVYDTAGKEAADWLMYGAASNFMLHPDAKVNLYSRGDINPRQVTVIPTSFADVPVVGATSKFFGSIWDTTQKINKGADVWSSFLQGVEHSGISRPLAGFAQVMQSTVSDRGTVFSTDNAGNIVMENELFSIMTASRLAGAKPLDEAVALDAIQRTQVYKAASKRQLANLGEAIKVSVVGGNVPDADQISGFIHEYAKAGGNQQNFNAYYHKQILGANRSKVNQMINDTSNPGNEYIQKMMGGYELQDMMNTPAEE